MRPFSKCIDKEKAQAQANANYFNRPYVVFFSTSGKVCVWRGDSYSGERLFTAYPQMPATDEDFYKLQGRAGDGALETRHLLDRTTHKLRK